jgi:hypothetical protein
MIARISHPDKTCLPQKLRSAENNCLSGKPCRAEQHALVRPTGFQLFQFPVLIFAKEPFDR